MQPNRSLRPESDSDRIVAARVTDADVLELTARMMEFNTTGQVLNQAGMVETTSGPRARAMFFAKPASSGVTGAFLAWLREQD